MNMIENLALRSPDIASWPWKSASPQIFWRLHIGRRIRARREQMPADRPTAECTIMSRDALARHLGLPTLNVWEIENGIITVEAPLLARLAEVLQVHPGWFFDVEPLPQWVNDVDKNRFLHRLATLLSPLTPGDFDVIETVFRYLAGRRRSQATMAKDATC